MIDTLAEMLSYPFMVRAFTVGALVALCSALLGVSLVLKRYSMIGDGLSHEGFGALAVAAALNMTPLAVAIPVVIVAAVLLLRISGNSKIKGDAAIALISTSSLAVGVMVISVTTGMNTDCIQLYVRKHSGDERGRCKDEHCSLCDRPGSLYLLLPEDFCHHL